MKIKNKKNKKKIKLDSLKRILPTSIVIFLMIALLLTPVPFIKISPGPLFNTVGKEMDQEVISINGVKTYLSKGELNFTTVSETGGPFGRLVLIDAISAWIDPTQAVVPSSDLYPEVVDPEVIKKENERAFSGSQTDALIRTERLLALIEGWIYEVVNIAALGRLPAIASLQEAMIRRRAVGGPAEKTFGALIGLDLRPKLIREAADSLKAINAIISDSFTCKPLANSFIFLGTNAGVVVSPKGIPISVKQSTSLESAARPLLICIENIAADIGFNASNSGLSISF